MARRKDISIDNEKGHAQKQKCDARQYAGTFGGGDRSRSAASSSSGRRRGIGGAAKHASASSWPAASACGTLPTSASKQTQTTDPTTKPKTKLKGRSAPPDGPAQRPPPTQGRKPRLRRPAKSRPPPARSTSGRAERSRAGGRALAAQATVPIEVNSFYVRF